MTRGPGRGVCGARRGLRHEGAVQKGERGERNKGERGRERERIDRKAAMNECVFIPGKGQVCR